MHSVVVTTLVFQAGRPRFKPWLDLRGRKIIEEKKDKDAKTVGTSDPYQFGNSFFTMEEHNKFKLQVRALNILTIHC